MNEKCQFCSSDLTTFDTKAGQHLKCPSCNTYYNSSYVNTEINFDLYNEGEFHDKYVSGIPIMINADKKHYDGVVRKDRIAKQIETTSYENIYSFGGGCPKLESKLISKKIFVFDLNSNLYVQHKDKFCQTFNVQSKKIDYTTAFIDETLIKSFNYNENDLITFIHFLEHFQLNDMQLMLDAAPTNISILIYEPNSNTCKNRSWFHFDQQHVVLKSDETLCKYLKNRYNAEIIMKETCSDDMLVLFKKH